MNYQDNNVVVHSANYKYVKREWKNGRWNYTYEDGKAAVKNAASSAASTVKAQGSKVVSAVSNTYQQLQNKYSKMKSDYKRQQWQKNKDAAVKAALEGGEKKSGYIRGERKGFAAAKGLDTNTAINEKFQTRSKSSTTQSQSVKPQASSAATTNKLAETRAKKDAMIKEIGTEGANASRKPNYQKTSTTTGSTNKPESQSTSRPHAHGKTVGEGTASVSVNKPTAQSTSKPHAHGKTVGEGTATVTANKPQQSQNTTSSKPHSHGKVVGEGTATVGAKKESNYDVQNYRELVEEPVSKKGRKR